MPFLFITELFERKNWLKHKRVENKNFILVVTDLPDKGLLPDAVHRDDAPGDAFVAVTQFSIVERFTTRKGGVVSYGKQLSHIRRFK